MPYPIFTGRQCRMQQILTEYSSSVPMSRVDGLSDIPWLILSDYADTDWRQMTSKAKSLLNVFWFTMSNGADTD